MLILRMLNEPNALISAAKAEVIDPATVTPSMFGMRPVARTRRAVKAATGN